MASLPESNLAKLPGEEPTFLTIVSASKALARNGNVLRFKKDGNEKDTTIELATPESDHLCYFEVKIINAVEQSGAGGGGVCVGVGRSGYSVTKIPGERPLSMAFCSSSGNLFHGSRKSQPYGPPCSSGDTMGCGVDYGQVGSLADGGGERESSVRVWFTRNGEVAGPPVTTVKPRGGFCPLIGLLSRRDHVQYLGHRNAVPPYVEKPLLALPIHFPDETNSRCEVIYPCKGTGDTELTTRPGDTIAVSNWNYSAFWAEGSLNGQVGLFYKGFVKFEEKVEPVERTDVPKGYSVTFCGQDFFVLEEPESWLFCNICLQLPKEPRISKCCAHSFCLMCCEKWSSRNSEPSCPLCRFKPFEILVDPRSDRSIKALTACCPSASRGCRWKGGVPAANQHYTECPLATVTCPNNCKTPLVRQDLADHCNRSCKNAKIQCPCCSRYVLTQAGAKVFMQSPMKHKELMTAHHLACPDWPCRCPSGCGTADHLTRGKLDHHLRNECSAGLIPCPCKGCPEKVKRKDREAHLLDSTFMPVHFCTLLSDVLEMKVQFKTMAEDNRLLKLRVTELERHCESSNEH